MSGKKSAQASLSALGVVFGDIGTSPLYAFGIIFGSVGYRLALTRGNILGVVSLIIWSITLVVSLKFVGFIMRADNAGEGGIMALVTKIKESSMGDRYKWLFVMLGLVGVSLFYGDSTITPAISVLSAVEGVKVVAPSLAGSIVPITLVLLVVLFGIQRYGTSVIGRLFGPVMLVWFLVIAMGGGWQVAQHPGILAALSPLVAIGFFIVHPLRAFLAMGAVVLAITGAEALYADMGHFGRHPIARAWFVVAFPALLLSYMGQGALLLHSPEASANPFVLLFPEQFRVPVVILATAATIIASQSVISGAFSLTRQAVQLSFLPKMLIRYTSSTEGGQIYLPLVNLFLFVSVCLLVVLFGSSDRLAGAYGIAVSGTLATDTVLYLAVMHTLWKKPAWQVALATAIFLPIDLILIAANLPKVLQGGWFPLAIGLVMFVIITTWIRGQVIAAAERKTLEGSLQHFADFVHAQKPPIIRVPGTAVFIGHHPGFAPLALQATLRDLHELPEKVVVVCVETAPSPHVPEDQRGTLETFGHKDGITYVNLSYGFHDSPNVPHALEYLCCQESVRPILDLDLDTVSYFVSRSRVVPVRRRNLSDWRKQLFCLMANSATGAADFYRLPIDRTIELQSLIPL